MKPRPIRWHEGDIEALEAAAKKQGITFSAFVRRAALAALDAQAVFRISDGGSGATATPNLQNVRLDVKVDHPTYDAKNRQRSTGRPSRPRKGLCEHRIPTDAYCPRCDG